MELSEMINVMQHYENGGDVEFKRKCENDIKWAKLLPIPAWNWDTYEYRIKQQKQKVTIEKWLCRSDFGNFVILECSNVNMLEAFTKVKLIESYEVEL